MMYRDLEHPEVTWAIRTGYPSWMQEDDVLNDEDDEEEEHEIWGDECEDDLYDESRERELFD